MTNLVAVADELTDKFHFAVKLNHAVEAGEIAAMILRIRSAAVEVEKLLAALRPFAEWYARLKAVGMERMASEAERAAWELVQEMTR